MDHYDLCLAWDWEYDADFASLLDRTCRYRGVSLLQITSGNLPEMVQSLSEKKITFRTFFDRASDANTQFTPVVQWACDRAMCSINFYKFACRARNKAEMHEAICDFMHTPHTIILPSYWEQPVLPAIDLGLLGTSFAIKPAGGGGGVGVINRATSFDQVLAARQEFPAQRYLLQANIVTARLGSRTAWFRVIYCAGKVYPCWWDCNTHVYAPVTPGDEEMHGLSPLRNLAIVLAGISRLELFSTEIALTPEGRFVVIDYINDPLDLRLQSKAFDGVPDEIVHDIAETLLIEKVLTKEYAFEISREDIQARDLQTTR